MSNQRKKNIPGPAIGLYICSVIMVLLFLVSVLGIMISGSDGNRPFFVVATIVTAIMAGACVFMAKWLTEKAASKNKTFPRYAFEGEFAPQKKKPVEPKKTGKH